MVYSAHSFPHPHRWSGEPLAAPLLPQARANQGRVVDLGEKSTGLITELIRAPESRSIKVTSNEFFFFFLVCKIRSLMLRGKDYYCFKIMTKPIFKYCGGSMKTESLTLKRLQKMLFYFGDSSN